jgi:sugar transferase (PEP-CTERM/EpsH1 system associated)
MTAPPVIVHVVNSLDTGGLENGVVNLVNATGHAFRHVIVCLTTQGALRKRLRSSVEVFAIGKKPGHDIRAFVRLIGLLRRLRPVVVHSRNWATFDAILAARLARVPVVIHGEHGRDATDPEGRHPLRNRVRRAVCPLVSRFVTVSHDLREWLVKGVGIPAHKVTTIHNGVDGTRFGGISRVDARAALGMEVDEVVVGTVGRLDPVKDQAGLVRAFARLASAHPAAVLAIAGGGPCRKELTEVIADLGLPRRVRLLGERSDIPVVLSAMDIFVLPSIAEGISNTVLEAMATGLPIVATSVGGNPELVEEGFNGRLVPPRNPDALAAAIGSYLDDAHLRDLHGKASQQRALDDFALDRMCSAYLHLYSGLLRGGAA